jgi:hypothetical protein
VDHVAAKTLTAKRVRFNRMHGGAIVDGAKRGSSGRGVMNAAKHSGFRTTHRKAGVINATQSQISACVAKSGQT